MPRKFFKKFMPKPHEIKNNKALSIFGTLLHDPNLWHMNRRSMAGAFMVGLFFAWWPVPFQMVLAAAGAIVLRTNLPMSIALVWITNPLTMPPMFYFAYVVGSWIIDVPEVPFAMELSMDWLMSELSVIWKPFLTGCLVLGVISSAAGYFGMNYLWARLVMKQRRHSLSKRK
ncbi:MAG: DUF2062 domain-containing protein [Gammaproteobacteria bacterium]|nr:DUF2062 domain-containing protein [Gammaproteobacteria bacterium]MCK5262426.1 DUF2062 domain-containing protein [Gammaproteobacteria bacterium]